MNIFSQNIIKNCRDFSITELPRIMLGEKVENFYIDKCNHSGTWGRYKPCEPNKNKWCPYYKKD